MLPFGSQGSPRKSKIIDIFLSGSVCVLLLFPVFANCLVSGLQFFIHVESFSDADFSVILGKYSVAISLFVFINLQVFFINYKVTNFQRYIQLFRLDSALANETKSGKKRKKAEVRFPDVVPLHL